MTGTGYGITCNNAGGLYYRQCKDSQGHEIIAYDSQGQPIGYDAQSGKTYLTALNSSGDAYQPYGSAGIPYTISGGGPLSSVIGNWLPSGGADPQAFQRLMSMPGAAARQKQATTTVPWYFPSFGLRKGPMVVDEKSWWSGSGLSFSSENASSDTPTSDMGAPSWMNKLMDIAGFQEGKVNLRQLGIRAAAVGVVGVVGYNMVKRGD